jgi:hypothetical protein
METILSNAHPATGGVFMRAVIAMVGFVLIGQGMTKYRLFAPARMIDAFDSSTEALDSRRGV